MHDFMQDDIGATPLCVSSQNGYTKIVSLLIEKGANVNYVTKVMMMSTSSVVLTVAYFVMQLLQCRLDSHPS